MGNFVEPCFKASPNFPASVTIRMKYTGVEHVCRRLYSHVPCVLKLVYDADRHKAPHSEPGPPGLLLLFSGIYGAVVSSWTEHLGLVTLLLTAVPIHTYTLRVKCF